MEIRLLGGFEVLHGGGVVVVRGAKQRALLAVLALNRDQVVPVDRLADALWGDAQPGNPANALQAQVSALRKLLPEPVLVTHAAGYTLDLAPDAVDAHRFERAVGDARELFAAGRMRDAAGTLRDALALWHGPALADFAYDDFAHADIVRLEELRLAAIELRIEADLAVGLHSELIGELETLCDAYPLREALWGHRMLALYRAGRQAESLRVFTQARARLIDELGIEPGPELRRLEAMILAQDPELASPGAPPAAPSRRVPGNLRARLTTFVGREREITDIAGAIERNRLVTLVGPGGAGKTRMAIEAADSLAPGFPDGVWLVELAPVVDPSGVETAIATAIGLRDSAGLRDTSPASPLQRSLEQLAGKRVLIVLDNCEHVIDESARVADELMGSLPTLTLLATSREALGVPGEQLIPLPPLPIETAVKLFADRALTVDRSFELDDDSEPMVTEICRRLDGLPLAVELAAARLRALPVRQIAGRLDDRFRLLTGGARTALPRQQTLRAVVDWSYDLLFDDERRLFQRLSAFPGGCTAEAAEAVCGDELLPAGDVVDVLARLVDKSLVVVDRQPGGDVRYRQLQTLWQYAREKLAESGDAERVRTRHADYYRQLAVDAEEGLRGRTGPLWRSRLTAELDNLRAALEWFTERDEGERALQLVTGMAWLWFLRAEWHDGLRWIREALSTSNRSVVTHARARAWLACYGTIVEGNDPHIADALQAADELREHGSAKEVGEAVLLLSSSFIRAGRFEDVLATLPEAQDALTRAGHQWGLAMHDTLHSVTLARLGRFDEAQRAAQSSVDRYAALGEQWAILEPLGTIAALREVTGDLVGAAQAYDEVIATARRLEVSVYLTFWLLWRGSVAARLGDHETAAAVFAEAAEVSRNPANTAYALVGLGRTSARLGRPCTEDERLGRAVELFSYLGSREGRAVALTAFGLTALECGDLEVARERAAQAHAAEPDVAALLTAALSLRDGSPGEAARLLDQWAHQFVPPLVGTLTATLVPDHQALAEALPAPV